MARKHGKQILHIDPALHKSPLDSASLVASWLDMHMIETLNVAGPRASKDPGIYVEALSILTHII